MRIVELTALHVRLPLKRPIVHASHTRDSSDNLLIRCRLADGTEGWGEGVPREYVTGETIEGAFEQLTATPLGEQVAADCSSWLDVIALCERLQLVVLRDDPRGCYGNALRAALELSILDAFGRLFGEPVSRVTQHFGPAEAVRASHDRVRYSGVITAETPRKEVISALKMRAYGFAHCKLKVGLPGIDETARVARIRRWLGRRTELRLDANEAWHAEELLAKVEPLVPFDICCLEQPVPHAEIDSLADFRRRLPIPIMLDESLTSLLDAQQAITDGTCDVFNIRLSKCGGFLNSLRMAALAHQHGLGYQLGCHPGESGLLSSAGRHWAASLSNIRWLEGSYDRHVLATQPTTPDITFRYGGWASGLQGPGLGVAVVATKLSALTLRIDSCLENAG